VSKDIFNVLDGWAYEPDELSVRIITGDDGREKIQLRLDLGVLQMEMDGRPDGLRPEGAESWLDYYEERQREHAAAHPDSAPWRLDAEDCGRLLREGLQYYHRYISLWSLDRYELCARDTARNLRLFAFVRDHARTDRDKLQFDQFRPYVTMMHARAVATPLVKARNYAAALKAIDEGIAGIRQFFDEYGQSDQVSKCSELTFLERWRKDVASKKSGKAKRLPRDPLQALRKELEDAVAEERFEDAARLRDEIRRINNTTTPLRADESL